MAQGGAAIQVLDASVTGLLDAQRWFPSLAACVGAFWEALPPLCAWVQHSRGPRRRDDGAECGGTDYVGDASDSSVTCEVVLDLSAQPTLRVTLTNVNGEWGPSALGRWRRVADVLAGTVPAPAHLPWCVALGRIATCSAAAAAHTTDSSATVHYHGLLCASTVWQKHLTLTSAAPEALLDTLAALRGGLLLAVARCVASSPRIRVGVAYTSGGRQLIGLPLLAAPPSMGPYLADVATALGYDGARAALDGPNDIVVTYNCAADRGPLVVLQQSPGGALVEVLPPAPLAVAFAAVCAAASQSAARRVRAARRRVVGSLAGSGQASLPPEAACLEARAALPPSAPLVAVVADTSRTAVEDIFAALSWAVPAQYVRHCAVPMAAAVPVRETESAPVEALAFDELRGHEGAAGAVRATQRLAMEAPAGCYSTSSTVMTARRRPPSTTRTMLNTTTGTDQRPVGPAAAMRALRAFTGPRKASVAIRPCEPSAFAVAAGTAPSNADSDAALPPDARFLVGARAGATGGVAAAAIGKAAFGRARFLGQWQRKFLLVAVPSCGGGVSVGADSICSGVRETVVCIDQHALHERIRLEYFVLQLLEGHGVASTPLVPAQSLDAALAARAWAVRDRLGRWGWRLSQSAAGAVAMTDVPLVAIDGHRYALRAVQQLADAVRDLWGPLVAHTVPGPVLQAAVLRSCRGAVMFGHALTTAQCEALVCAIPFLGQHTVCSHGRPSMCPLTDLAAPSLTSHSPPHQPLPPASSPSTLIHY